ncbi:MAG: DUF6737 family protein [Cyanobacteria bacterium P01_G01_bin.19]
MTPQSSNVWDYKPAWCQPWSIILTGICIIAASWLVLHLLWVTVGISVVIAVWWVYFLIIFPQAFSRYIKEQKTEFK